MTARHGVIAVAFLALVGARAAADEGPVWFWFAGCGGPTMALEVRLDGAPILESTFPVCRRDRESPGSQVQQSGSIHFWFKPERSIVWEGYRDSEEATKPGQLLRLDIWQAGADPQDLLIGVSVSDSDAIYMNTIHIAHPDRRDESELATGLTVTTYPVTTEKTRTK